MKNTYKVGDKVKIIDSLDERRVCGGVPINVAMANLRGRHTVIEAITTGDCHGKECYRLAIDSRLWHWTPEMLEPINSASKAEKKYTATDIMKLLNKRK